MLKIEIAHDREDTAGIGDKVSPVPMPVAQWLQGFTDRPEQQQNARPFENVISSKVASAGTRIDTQSRQYRERAEMGDETLLADLNGHAR